MIKTTLKIDGMACSMCEAHINDCIRKNFKIKKVSSLHKKGETVNKEKGFNAGRNWFAKTYPKSVSELKLTEKQKKEIEDAYKVYSEKNKDEADAMKKDEYTKYYYWTKIFVQK